MAGALDFTKQSDSWYSMILIFVPLGRRRQVLNTVMMLAAFLPKTPHVVYRIAA